MVNERKLFKVKILRNFDKLLVGAVFARVCTDNSNRVSYILHILLKQALNP